MDATVAQLLIVQVGFLGPFTCQLGDTGNRLSLFFRVEDLPLQYLYHLSMFVEEVIQLFLEEIVDMFAHRHSSREHLL